MFPLLKIEMRLIENASQCSHRDFGLLRNNRGVSNRFGAADELDVTALLRTLRKTSGFQSALHFAVGQGLKPRQPLPR